MTSYNVTMQSAPSGARWTETFSAPTESEAIEKALIAASFRDGVREWEVVMVEADERKASNE